MGKVDKLLEKARNHPHAKRLRFSELGARRELNDGDSNGNNK